VLVDTIEIVDAFDWKLINACLLRLRAGVVTALWEFNQVQPVISPVQVCVAILKQKASMPELFGHDGNFSHVTLVSGHPGFQPDDEPETFPSVDLSRQKRSKQLPFKFRESSTLTSALSSSSSSSSSSWEPQAVKRKRQVHRTTDEDSFYEYSGTLWILTM